MAEQHYRQIAYDIITHLAGQFQKFICKTNTYDMIMDEWIAQQRQDTKTKRIEAFYERFKLS